MKINLAMQKFLLVIFIITIVTFYPYPMTIRAALSSQDNAQLTQSLEILSQGWVQEHVNNANSILSKSDYTTSDWQLYFSSYFSTHPFTNELYNYLGYPVLEWFNPDARLKLQNGMLPVIQDTIATITQSNQETLSTLLYQDSTARSTLFNSHRFINRILSKPLISYTTRQLIYNFYVNHITDYPNYWKESTTINISTQPYISTFRAQILINLIDTLPITPERKDEVSQIIGLSGLRARIWNNHTILIIDNNGLDEAQLNTIHNLLLSIPQGIHDLQFITVNDLIGNTGQTKLDLVNNNKRAVNIFAVKVGVRSENGFPNDVAPNRSDLFSLVLAHEVNHIVDKVVSQTNPQLLQRRNELISSAGITQTNYLRSTIEEGYFVKNPQEFFASIANQWFSNTERTLQIGLVRWKNGFKQPINQFLFFAEVYSQKSTTIPFYTIDLEGKITRTDYPVVRNDNGYITSITTMSGLYEFSLDEKGNVTNISAKYTLYLPVIRN